ncbi:hypothetical protein D3C72_2082090 [compost metagenome]
MADGNSPDMAGKRIPDIQRIADVQIAEQAPPSYGGSGGSGSQHKGQDKQRPHLVVMALNQDSVDKPGEYKRLYQAEAQISQHTGESGDPVPGTGNN